MKKAKKLFKLPWRSAKQIRADIDDELSFHIDERVDALIALGVQPDTARAQAIREFGDIDDARQYLGAVDRDIEAAHRRSDLMQDFFHDLGYAVRKLRSSPAFTLAAVVTLALGIGANTAIFSVVNSVLLRPLPFAQPDRLVRLRFTQQGHPDVGTPMDLIDYRTQAKNLAGVALIEQTTANMSRDNGDAERVPGVRVSSNFFDLLRIKPVQGRFFLPDEEKFGAEKVAVMSEELWRRDFSGDAAVIGKPLRISGQSYTIVGIVPTGRRYPITADLWMVKQLDPDQFTDRSRGARWLGVLARIKDDVDPTIAGAEVARISESMEKQFPEQLRERRAAVVPLQEWMVGDVKKPLYTIMGAVLLVLLVACANVANLQLVRAAARENEMAVRTALGAGRGRLVRQLMTESVLLSLVGAAVGVVVAKAGMTKLLERAPDTLVLVQRSSIDGVALGVTAAVAVLTGLLFGVLPAMQASVSDLATTLRAGGRGARSHPGAHRTKRIIVVAELALAVMLLSGAGLLLRSFSRLMSVDPGFKPDGVMTMKVALPAARYDSTQIRAFVATVHDRVKALPGVQDAAVATFVPLDDGSYTFSFTIRGRTFARSSDEPSSETRQITPDFFRTMGMPIVRGRGIEETDAPGAPKVYVVNEAFAKRFFPNEDVIGQAIRLGWGRDDKQSYNQIVGVVGDVHSFGLEQEPEPTVYASVSQYPQNGLTIAARSSSPGTLAAAMRSIVRETDRDIPVYSVMTMTERVAASVGAQRFYATLIAIFAAVALILAAVGLYGVIAYAVTQRTHELGVRVALGATTDRISRMVIGEGLVLTAFGAALGVAGALLMGRVVSSLLFGVTARDPITLLGVVAALTVVATLASWLPARRAARVDPLVAMRGD